VYSASHPYISAVTAVVVVEYHLSTRQFSPQPNTLGFTSLKKTLNLDAVLGACRRAHLSRGAGTTRLFIVESTHLHPDPGQGAVRQLAAQSGAVGRGEL